MPVRIDGLSGTATGVDAQAFPLQAPASNNVFNNVGLVTLSKEVDVDYYLRPNSAIRASDVPYRLQNSVLAALASGSTYWTAVGMIAGDVVTNITFGSGTTVWSGATSPHRFFTLYDSGGNLLAYTDDDGANAWAANALKTLPITKNAAAGTISSYTIATSGVYFLGIVHSFGSGASNTFCGGASSINATIGALITPFNQCLITSALTGGNIPQTTLTPTYTGNRAFCYFT